MQRLSYVRTGRFMVRIPARARDSSPLQNAQTDFRDHPTSYWINTGDFSWWQSGRSVRLTTQIHPQLRLRMSGAIPPLLPICLHGVYTKNINLFFYPLTPAKFRDSTSTIPWLIPSKSFSIHTQPSTLYGQSYYECRKTEHKKWSVIKLQPSTPGGEQIGAWIYSPFKGCTQVGVG
jgi:hypothetical protein